MSVKLESYLASNELIFMLYNDMIMKKVVTIQKYLDGSVSREEATENLGCSLRTFYRYAQRYKDHGPPGLLHGLSWKKSNNRNKKREQFHKYAIQQRFVWFGPTLLSEKLEALFGYRIPIESLRRRMIERWTWVPRKPRKIKRHPRKRRSSLGMMIQFDGSYHDWLENGEERCLLLWVDDATWAIMHVEFTQSEAINDVIWYWNTYLALHGKPSSIYLDRHASYKVNHRKDQFDHTTKTRFQRAMSHLGICVIFANSPEWKWRVENKFRLFQDRWIKELRLAWINDYDEAERYLREVLIPERNKRYGVVPEVEWDFHVPITDWETDQLERFFAKRTKRKINKVWIVSYEWNKYLVPKWQTLNGTRDIRVLESHYGNIQIWNGSNQLEFKKVSQR